MLLLTASKTKGKNNISGIHKQLIMFVWFEFDSLRPHQQFFSYVEEGIPGLNQY